MLKNKRIISIGLLACAVMVSTLSGCGGSSTDTESATAAGTNTAVIELNMVDGANTGIFTLNPTAENGNRMYQFDVCETLFRIDNDTNEVVPFLAESYEHLNDLTWMIKIRDGITFSNGEPLTAQAAKAALEYEVANNTRVHITMNVDTIEADGQVLTIKTNDIVATMPNVLSNDVTQMFYYEEGSTDFDQVGIIGTGAFILENWDNQGNKELVRNENYWQGMPAASRIHVKPISDLSARTLALQSNELDWAEIQTSDVALFENNSGYDIIEYDKGRLYFTYLNPEYTFTQDTSLRQALQYAFDRESYIEGVYDGRGSATTAIFPDWSGFHDSSVQQKSYDVEQARKILEDAGYTDSDGDGFLEKNGEKVTLNITTYASNGFETLSQAVQASLKDIGIDSQIIIAEQITETLSKGEFNIAIFGHSTLTLGDSFNILESIFSTTGYENYIHYSNETIDHLIKQMQKTADPDERKELTVEIQKEIYDSDNYVFLLFVKNYNIVRNGVQNVGTFRNNDAFDLWKVTK